MYDEFGFTRELSSEREQAEQAPRDRPRIREQFPEAGTAYLDGFSDGWEYRTVFAGTKMEHTYDMVKRFLIEEGYGDLPVPQNVEELRLFQRPRKKQLQLFDEYGYFHNPIKIIFPEKPSVSNTLILCIYNESAAGHLLRFHGLLKTKIE